MELTKESLELLRRVAPGYVGIYRIDGDSVTTLYSSPNLHELLGLTAEEFQAVSNRDVKQFIIAEDLPDTMAAVRRCVETGEPFDHYARVVHKELGFDWVHGNLAYSGEYEGSATLVCTFSNASVESNIYLSVIDNSERSVYVCDWNTFEILYMNKAAREDHKGEYLGQTCYSRIRGAQGRCENCFLGELERGKQYVRVRRNELTGAWERLIAERIDWCGHDAFIQYIDDITESEELKRDLQRAKRRYDLAIDSAELGVWEYHIKEHTISSPSESFKRFGVTGEIRNVPESILPLFPEEERDKLLRMFERLDAGERKVTEDFWMRWHPDSPLRCERVVYTTVEDEGGKPSVAYGIGMNVTLEKQEEARYQNLLQSLLMANPDALCAFELNLTKNTCGEGHGISPFIMRILQSDTVDGLFRNIVSLIGDEPGRDRFQAAFTREKLLAAFESGRMSLSVDYRRRGENGKQFWARTYANMIRNPETQDVTAIIYSVDISAEKRHEEILSVITSQEHDLIGLLHTKTGQFEAVFLGESLPQEYRRFLPEAGSTCDFEELSHFAAENWLDPVSVDEYREVATVKYVKDMVARRGEYEFTLTEHFKESDAGGMRRRYQHYPLNGEPDTVIIIESDVTAAFRREQNALAQAKAETEHVQDILNSVSAGICVLHMPDPEHLSIEYVNQQMYRLLGFAGQPSDIAANIDTIDEKVIKYARDAYYSVHPDDLERVRKTFRENFGSSHFSVDDYRVLGADDRYRWIREEVTLREIRSDCRVYYAVYHDVSEEVRLKQRLQEQLEEEKSLRAQADAANASKSSFLSSVSHDMRTPLNGVLGYADLALNSDDPAVVRDYLLKTKDAGQTLLALINDTLDLSKIETGKLELHRQPISCGELIHHIVTAVKPTMDAKRIEFTLDNERAVMTNVNVDVLLAEKVFLNLLNNATKFTPEGGHITMRIECLGIEPDRVHDKISVSDDGIGISEEFLPKVFEPFAQERTEKTSKIGGSGLGLSIVKEIVELMGGRIEVDSQLGKGTTFTVWLDFEIAKDAPAGCSLESPANDVPADALVGKRLLLVEDNEMNVEIARTLLESRDAVVSRAENGKVAVEMVSAAPDAFDCVLMDIRMPVMDGCQAARAIRALDAPRAKTIPIIAMSADAYESDVERSLEAGMNAHVSKPIDPPVLFRAIYQVTKD